MGFSWNSALVALPPLSPLPLRMKVSCREGGIRRGKRPEEKGRRGVTPSCNPQSRDAVAGATRRQQDFYGTILELLIRFPRSWPHIRIYSRFFFQYVGPRRPAASRNRPNNTCTFHLPMRRLGAATYLLASVWIQC